MVGETNHSVRSPLRVLHIEVVRGIFATRKTANDEGRGYCPSLALRLPNPCGVYLRRLLSRTLAACVCFVCIHANEGLSGCYHVIVRMPLHTPLGAV